MPFQQRRRRVRLHWADLVASLLVAVSLVPLILWLASAPLVRWEAAPGEVLSVAFNRYSTNVDRLPDEVRVHYRYTVAGIQHTGHWQGAWPSAYSPDAVARDRLERLIRQGLGLTVYHDPLRPHRSTLHTPVPDQSALLPIVSCVAFPLTLVALRRTYPRFRGR
jgi:hypothetical protein